MGQMRESGRHLGVRIFGMRGRGWGSAWKNSREVEQRDKEQWQEWQWKSLGPAQEPPEASFVLRDHRVITLKGMW